MGGADGRRLVLVCLTSAAKPLRAALRSAL